MNVMKMIKYNENDKKVFSLSILNFLKERERDGNSIISPNTRKSICIFKKVIFLCTRKCFLEHIPCIRNKCRRLKEKWFDDECHDS